MIVVNFDPNVVSFHGFAIKWYSLAYLFGLLIGWYLSLRNVKKTSLQLSKNDIEELFLTYGLLGVIIGGRLGYVLFYNLSFYLKHPLQIFALWNGGMSFHGGVIGVITALFIFAKIKKISFIALGDLVCLVAPVGLFLGRIGNFINSELYGNITDASFPFAVVFEKIDIFPRHPSQLYEAFGEGIVIFAVLNLIWHFLPTSRTKHGLFSGLFLLMYGIVRIIVENFRTPDIQIGYLWGNITMGQILCLPMIAAGIFLIAYACTKSQTGNEPPKRQT